MSIRLPGRPHVRTAAAAAIITPLLAPMAALQSAGVQVIPPSGGSLFQQLIRTLQGNLDWLLFTVMGLVLTGVVALLVFGSQRAPDHLFRIVGAIALLVIGIPAVLK